MNLELSKRITREKGYDVVLVSCGDNHRKGIASELRESGWNVEEEADSAMEKMVSEEIDVEEMVDIVGIQKDYDRRAVLSQDFMEEMADEQPENVRMKLLKRIVENEIEERKGRKWRNTRHSKKSSMKHCTSITRTS